MRSAKGSIQKLGKDHYRVFVSIKDDHTGKRYRPSAVVRGSRRKAEETKLRMLAEAESGKYAGQMTLAAYIDAVYMPSLSHRKPRTIATAADRCRLYVVPKLGQRQLCDITPANIRLWLEAFAKPSVRFVAFVTLRQVLNHALHSGHMENNPIKNVPTPAKEKYEPAVLDAEDALVYLWHFKGSPIEAAVLIAIGAGLRRGEIAALDVADINLATGLVDIDKANTQHGREVYYGEPKSAKGTRGVHLPETILKRLREVLPPRGAILTEDGQRMAPDRITALYSQHLKRLPEGVLKVPLMNLRHTSLTLAYDSGADLLAVSRRAGHSGTSITDKYYVRPKGSRDKETAKAMDKALELCSKMCQTQRTIKSFEVIYEF